MNYTDRENRPRDAFTPHEVHLMQRGVSTAIAESTVDLADQRTIKIMDLITPAGELGPAIRAYANARVPKPMGANPPMLGKSLPERTDNDSLLDNVLDELEKAGLNTELRNRTGRSIRANAGNAVVAEMRKIETLRTQNVFSR